MTSKVSFGVLFGTDGLCTRTPLTLTHTGVPEAAAADPPREQQQEEQPPRITKKAKLQVVAERHHANVSGIMSSTPFTSLDLTEQTQKVL